MTSQTKKFIELTDIIGLRVLCKNPECQTSLLIEEKKIASLAQNGDTTLVQCPVCKHSWTVPPRDPEAYPGASNMGLDKEIKQFLQMLVNMRDFQKKLGCRLMFEIEAHSETRFTPPETATAKSPA